MLLQWLFRWRFRVAILIVIWLGFGLRIMNVGRLALVGDEGSTFVAARAIALRGVPILDTGLWVTRGLPHLYMVAPSLHLFGENELALRLPGVMVGTLTIVMSYKLCHCLFNSQDVALTAAAIVAFHPWEVEFSRTARMYVTFQLWIVVLLYCFYQGFVRESLIHQLCFILVAVVSTIDHVEALSMLSLFSYLPLVKPWKRLFSPGYLLACVIAAVGPVGYYFLRLKIFHGISVLRPPSTKALPTDVGITNKISLLTRGTFGSLWTLKTFFAIAGPVIFSAIVLGSTLLLLFLAWLAVTKKRVNWVVPAAYLYWSLIVLLVFFSMLHGSTKPDVPLSDIRDLKPRNIYHIFPLAIYVYSFTLTYFIIFASQFLKSKRIQLGATVRTVIMPALLSVGVFVAVSPRELPQLVFRKYSDPIPDRTFLGTTVKNALQLATHYDFHPDFRTTSLYVVNHYKERDAVLVMGPADIYFFYLGDRMTHRIGLTGGGGAFVNSNNELWELRVDIPRISSVQSIFGVMADYERVWIIHPYQSNAPSPVEKWVRSQSKNLVYQGQDRISKVYLFDEVATRSHSNHAWDLFYALPDVNVTAEGSDFQSYELALNKQQVWIYDDRLFLGPSSVTVAGIAFDNQLMYHPFSNEMSTNIRTLVKNNHYAFLEASYALPDAALAAGSNGVEYSILISVDNGTSWRVLLREQIQQANWQVRRIDLEPYQDQDIILWLIADPVGQYDYDWLQITFRLLPDDQSSLVTIR